MLRRVCVPTSRSPDALWMQTRSELLTSTVVLISPSGAVMAATTDNEGNYSFKVAPSQKTYRVIPSKDGYTFTSDRSHVCRIV